MDIYEKYVEMIKNMTAPGLPESRIAIFKNSGEDLVVYTESGKLEYNTVNDYINLSLFQWGFIKGVHCCGMEHGSFVVERSYSPAKEVVLKKEEDYYLDVEPLNYVCAFLAEANERNKEKNTIVMIQYGAEADYTFVDEFQTEEDFYEYAEEALKDYDYDGEEMA